MGVGVTHIPLQRILIADLYGDLRVAFGWHRVGWHWWHWSITMSQSMWRREKKPHVT